MKVGSILSNDYPSDCNCSTREMRGRSSGGGGGKLLKSSGIVDMVVVLEDGVDLPFW
jgi:hypothetical protein